MFLVACVVAFQLSEHCYGKTQDETSVAEDCPAWSALEGGESLSPSVSTPMLDVHGRRLMQMDSFVTRLAREQMDSGSKHGRSKVHPGKHGQAEEDDQGSREDELEGNVNLDKKGRNMLSKRPSSKDTVSEERIATKDNRDLDGNIGPRSSAATDVSKASEKFHLMALRAGSTRSGRSASVPHEKAGHALAEGSHAESKASTSHKAKSSHRDANPTHKERSTAHAQAGHAAAGPTLEERDSSKGKSVTKTKASEPEFESHDKEEVTASRHRLHAQEQKVSHKRREKTHSLLNPAIMTVMFLMSAPAGMLLLAFGSLLWAKSHGDVTMGGGG